MRAPREVVEAVAKARHATQETGYEWDSYPSSWWDLCREEAQPIADAAWKASLNAAAERIDAECSKDDWGVPSAYSVTLNRWAEEDQP